MSFEERLADLRWRQTNLTGALFAVRKPTIAALPGAAAGAGLAIALACDMRIAAKSAFCATGYARIGLSGDYGIAWLLTRAVGPMRARELMLTAERVDAERCERIGLVNRVVDDAKLQDEAFALAKSLAEGPQHRLPPHQGQSRRGAAHRLPDRAAPRGRAAGRRLAHRRSQGSGRRLRREAQAGVQGALVPCRPEAQRSDLARHQSLRVLNVGPPHSLRTSITLVAVRRARRKELAIRPRLVDGAREGRARQQPRPMIAGSCGEPLADRVDPVGVEQRRRGGAVGHREVIARRPLAALQSSSSQP